MRLSLVPAFVLLSAVLAHAQTGPCTEAAVQRGNLAAADDAFSYMPPFGRPVVGKTAIQSAGAKRFSNRTNITRTWVGEHKIVPTAVGDMAYEYGTVRMGYDEGGRHNEFEAVILSVYKAKDGVCQIAASTMQPLEDHAGGR